MQALEDSRKQAEEKNSANVESLIAEKSRLEKELEERESTIQSIQEAIESKDNVRMLKDGFPAMKKTFLGN